MRAYNTVMLMLVGEREARGDGREAIRAVVHVVANRVKAGWGDWLSVITKKNQFSSITVVGDSQTVFWPGVRDVIDIWSLVNDVYDGRDADNTGGALYYSNEAISINNEWYRNEIINKPTEHPVTVVIGKQTFRK